MNSPTMRLDETAFRELIEATNALGETYSAWGTEVGIGVSLIPATPDNPHHPQARQERDRINRAARDRVRHVLATIAPAGTPEHHDVVQMANSIESWAQTCFDLARANAAVERTRICATDPVDPRSAAVVATAEQVVRAARAKWLLPLIIIHMGTLGQAEDWVHCLVRDDIAAMTPPMCYAYHALCPAGIDDWTAGKTNLTRDAMLRTLNHPDTQVWFHDIPTSNDEE